MKARQLSCDRPRPSIPADDRVAATRGYCWTSTSRAGKEEGSALGSNVVLARAPGIELL